MSKKLNGVSEPKSLYTSPVVNLSLLFNAQYAHLRISYKKLKKFINPKFPNWAIPDLFHKKSPQQDFIRKTLRDSKFPNRVRPDQIHSALMSRLAKYV